MTGFGDLFDAPEWGSLLNTCAIILAAVVCGWIIQLALFAIFNRIARRAGAPAGMAILVRRLRSPSRMLIPLLTLMLAAPTLQLPAAILAVLQHVLSLCFLACITWLFIEATLAGRDAAMSRYDIGAIDNFKARALYTQLTVIVKVVVVIVIIICLAAMLMTFARIRAIGVSILASAGIIGLTVGFAAQKSIATLLAGLQIAVTQPIRINDMVVVEGEFGTIEEITLTYVVVKIWDLRRLVVPVTYFLEKPFQNWTRSTTNLLGTVLLYADYTVPIAEVRQQLHEILQGSDRWDREVWGLQVTNVSQQTLELRALMSAANSAAAWELRCEVREKLLSFLQENYPDTLPKVRGELHLRASAEAET